MNYLTAPAAFVLCGTLLTSSALAQDATSAATKPGVALAAPLLQNPYGRSYLSLNGRWNYIIDPYETGYYDYRRMPFDQSASGKGGYYDDRKPKDGADWVEYDFDTSPNMKVPADWNSQAEKLQFYEGTIWLRQTFIAEPKADKRYFLYFGAVNYEAQVYLNGKKLGSHKGGFTPFQFEVTGKLSPGRNFVVVKADNQRHQDEIPTVNTDWWNYGGITRDVMLLDVPATYISDYKVQLAKGKLNQIEGFVQLAGESSKAQSVRVSIPEAGIDTTVTTDASGRAALTIPVARMQYWTPESPKLYTVEISGASDRVSDRIGFRTIETRGQDILLNGKSIFLRGISMHEENPLIPGRPRGEGDMRMLLQWAKDLNANYVRLAHYPHNEQMARLADEMGLLVWAEVPVYWTISWSNADTYQNAETQLKDLMTRDKNRSSVIIWSVGNETPVSAPRNLFMNKLAAIAHAGDNTRLIAAALEVRRNDKDPLPGRGAPNEMIVEDPLAEAIDLVSFNEYAGWYFSNNKDMLNYHYNVTYKNKPVVISEFGADALGGYHASADTRWSEEYQELLYQNQIKMLTAIPGLRGMTPWILVDFRSPRRPHPYFQEFWNRKGLISETGKKKKAFFTLKAFYDDMQKTYK